MLKRTFVVKSPVSAGSRMKVQPPSEASYKNNANIGRRPIAGSESSDSGIGLRVEGSRGAPSSRAAAPSSSSAGDKGKTPPLRPGKPGIFGRLHARYLGVDPNVLARYGDGSQSSRMLHFAFAGMLVVGVALNFNNNNQRSWIRQTAQATMEDNRKRFYGHDFDQPMGEVSKNFQKNFDAPNMGDIQVIVSQDERTGLMETADGRMIAPAKWERGVRESPEITNAMMERMSNLSRMRMGYLPKTNPDLDGNAPAKLR